MLLATDMLAGTARSLARWVHPAHREVHRDMSWRCANVHGPDQRLGDDP